MKNNFNFYFVASCIMFLVVLGDIFSETGKTGA